VPIVQTAEEPILKFLSTNKDSNGHAEMVYFAITTGKVLENQFSMSKQPEAVACSFAGGCILEIEAPGLSSVLKSLPNDNHVYACGKRCEYTEDGSSVQKAQCRVPPLSTIYSDLNFKISQEDNDLPVLKYSGTGSASELKKINDGDLTSPFSSNADTCTINFEFPEGYIALLSEVRYFYTNINAKQDVLGKLTFQGSDDFETFEDIFVVDDSVREGWNTKTWETVPEYQ